MGCDFIIIRAMNEKIKPCVLSRWSLILNSIIELNSLMELKIIGSLHTWANNLAHPTSKKLDRILVCTE
jgi:hypothetical protein